MAVVIPVTGWFLQRVTTRQRVRDRDGACSAPARCWRPLAPTFPVLLAARVVQASGTAVMMPLLMTTLMTVVPEHDRGRVMGNVTLAMSVAPALGPAVSGVVLQSAVVALDVRRRAARRARDHGARPAPADQHRRAADAAPSTGSAWSPSAVGFGGLVYGLSQLGAGERGRGVAACCSSRSALLAIAVFVRRQLVLQRTGTPLLDLRTLELPHLHGLAAADVAWRSWRCWAR